MARLTLVFEVTVAVTESDFVQLTWKVQLMGGTLGAVNNSSSSTSSRNDGRPFGSLKQIANAEFLLGVEAWNAKQPLVGLNLLLRSAQKGYEVGEYLFRWGLYHESPPSNFNEALRWYGRGARMNHRACVTMLGKLHLSMGRDTQAIDVLSRTARPHSSLSNHKVLRDIALQRGLGGPKGDSLAQWFLGELYLRAARLREAVKWWKRSAENGDSDAMLRLSQVLSAGVEGIPKDPSSSRHWLFAAAAHGNQEALKYVNWSTPLSQRLHCEQRWIVKMESEGWL